jgi:hypothetical protein
VRGSMGRMPWEAINTSARHRSVGVVLRAGALGRLPRPLMIGAGLLTGGAVVALAHITGADLRGLTGSQPGLLMGLLPGFEYERPS